MKAFLHTLLLLFLPLSLAHADNKAPWVVDHANSTVEFSVNHMTISEIQGRFDDFYVSIDADSNKVEGMTVALSLNVTSINTGLEQRDDHLRSADFFDTEKYPTATFRSKEIRHISGKLYAMRGDLTIKETTKEVDLQLIHGGKVQDYWGNLRTGIKVFGSFNRFDFGLNWAEALEAGGLIVGKEVNLMATIEAYQQKGGYHLAEQAVHADKK